jgi:hypothetical protein
MPWDGDDLAGQMEETFERQDAAAEARTHRSTSVEERARNAEIESLRLSRARVLGELAKATNPAHRTMLERALQSINSKLADSNLPGQHT